MSPPTHNPPPGAGAVAGDDVAAPALAGDGAAPAFATPGEVELTVRGRSSAKPNNDYFKAGDGIVWRRNEDRFRFADTPDGLVAAVADGAGSSGMYCGAWAEALVERLPETPLAGLDDLNRWIDGFWEEFSAEAKRGASGDAAKLSKFVREGSYATLVACWIAKRDDGGATMQWLGYGDSLILAFGRDGDDVTLVACYPSTLGEMEHDPHLLNWKDLPKDSHLRVGTVEVPGPASVVLASDGIGQFVLMRYLADALARHDQGAPAEPAKSLLGEFRPLVASGAGKLADLARANVENPGSGFAGELAALDAGLESDHDFLEMIRDHHRKGLLSNDDATLIIVDIEAREAGGAREDGAP